LGKVKTLSVNEAQGQLGDLIAEAAKGNAIVLKDGDREVFLAPRSVFTDLNLEEDGPELEAELLKAVEGPHRPLGKTELRDIADRVRGEHQARRGA
jgi:hypothetical protein